MVQRQITGYVVAFLEISASVGLDRLALRDFVSTVV